MCCIDNYRNLARSCHEPLHLKRSAPESFQALKLGWSAAPREDKAGFGPTGNLVTGKDLVNLGVNFYECSYFPKQFFITMPRVSGIGESKAMPHHAIEL